MRLQRIADGQVKAADDTSRHTARGQADTMQQQLTQLGHDAWKDANRRRGRAGARTGTSTRSGLCGRTPVLIITVATAATFAGAASGIARYNRLQGSFRSSGCGRIQLRQRQGPQHRDAAVDHLAHGG